MPIQGSHNDYGSDLLPKITLLFLFVCLFSTACSQNETTRRPQSYGSTHPDYAVNINTATLDELTSIPHVGEKVAAKIIEHREVNGPFRRAEHLMLIQGISDTRFRKIRPMVRVE